MSSVVKWLLILLDGATGFRSEQEACRICERVGIRHNTAVKIPSKVGG
jgi:hypothetical protein